MRYAAMGLALFFLAGCDFHRYEYVEAYQGQDFVILDQGGRKAFFTAAASFAEALPGPPPPAPGRAEREAADYEYRYLKAHPEIYGPLGSRADYEREYGGGSLSAAGVASLVTLTVSGNYAASFELVRGSARLVGDSGGYPVVVSDAARVAVGDRHGNLDSYGEGAPLHLEFPAVPGVTPRQERLTVPAINRRPPPAPEPLRFEVAVRDEGGVHPLVFTFRRVAQHEPFPPNPLYWLYAAH